MDNCVRRDWVMGTLMETETCENCGRTIGKLERAHVYDGHVVCGDCIRRLSATDEVQAPVVVSERVMFQYGDLSVTTKAIRNGDGSYPIDYILSVRPTRTSFSFAINVQVIDLARGSRTYRLPDRRKAAEFIRAIQAVKGSINVESDNDGFFVMWW